MQIGLGCRLKLVGLVEAKELAMTDWVCLGWYGAFPHDRMATLFVLSTQGKSGILGEKGGQGRAPSNLAKEFPPGEQPR
jgi:hypothetical protein